MTDKQINQRIAEACGWKEMHVNGDAGVYKGFDNGAELRPDIPDYCADLNAMHEAEKVLGNRLSSYGELLCEMTVANEPDFAECYIWHATARQRAEAFLRTLGKWEEATDKDSLTVGATTEQSSAVGWPPLGTRCLRMNADGKWEEVQQ